MITPSNPYPDYARLREAGPVHRIEGPDGSASWLVTRYDDVRRGLADPRLSVDRSNASPGNYRGLALPPALDANLLNMDPPDHTRIRKLVARAFTVRRIEDLRTPIRSTANRLLDDLMATTPIRGTDSVRAADAVRGGDSTVDAVRGGDSTIDAVAPVDLIAGFAAPLPIAVICDLLGVPDETRTDFRQWTDTLLTPPSPEAARAAIGAMLKFFADLIATKRAHPADDLLGAMIAARDDGDRLTDDELTSLVFLILFAGYENVVHLIGTATLALLDHPSDWQRLQQDRSLVPAAVDELMRYDAPAPLAIRRFPVEDVTIGGVTIPAGEAVLLGIASANRDAARFPDADRLDFDRAVGGHLALGHGIHYCLGAPLARLELVVALEALLDRLPGLTLAVPRDELEWRPSIRTRGLAALPVVVG